MIRATLLLLLLLAANGCRKAAPKEAADSSDKPVLTVQAAHPTLGPITESIEVDATLAPEAEAAIQPRIAAPVKVFYVQRGAHVRAGQLLATLENRDLSAAALDNKGTYTAAQGAYTAATRQQIPQEETQARLDLEQARATLALDQSILTARSQLFAQGAIPGRDVDTAKATASQAQAAFQIAQQKFDQIASTGRMASLQTAEGQLTSAKAKYLGAQAQLAYTEIRSPMAGIVTDRPLFVGETASPGTPLLTVMDTSRLVAKLHLPQRQAQQLAAGASASIAVSGIADPIPARVSLISPALDPGSTTVEVWLTVSNPNGRLRPGSAVHATIAGRTEPNALQVPTDAVQRSPDTGSRIVMVIAPDGTAHKRNVTTGVQTTVSTQITQGLTQGDTVILTGGYGLDEGTKVKAGPASAKPEAGEKE